MYSFFNFLFCLFVLQFDIQYGIIEIQNESEVQKMAGKSANVIARVEPDIKAEAEAILEQLGLPVSVVINSLYRQIIMTNGIPFPMTVPAQIRTRDEMTAEEFHALLQRGLEQAEADDGMALDDAFASLKKRIR